MSTTLTRNILLHAANMCCSIKDNLQGSYSISVLAANTGVAGLERQGFLL